MLWLALAAQLSLPTLSNMPMPDVRAVFSADDYPDYLLSAGLSGTVYTRTTVRPDGSIQGCVAEISSTDPKLDAYTCGIIVKRARFRPATWTDGTASWGVIRVPVRWVISNGPPPYEEGLRATVPDIDLFVDHLPKGVHSIASVSLEIGADEKGRPVTCAEIPPTDRSGAKRRFPELVPLACEQAMTSLSVIPAVDDSGQAVRSVQGVSVHFRVNH